MSRHLLLTLCLLPCGLWPAKASDDLDRAFARLYSFDFDGAHAILDAYTAASPQDPRGYSARAAAYLFFELHRLGILETEFFTDDDRIADKKKIRADPDIRRRFYAATGEAESRAQAALAVRPDDADALFAQCMASGLITDYSVFVDKKLWGSYSLAKRSNQLAQQLLKLDPQYYDAYVTTGMTEYLVGSLPFFARWLVRFDDIKGAKQVGISNLRRASESGRYLKPFAKILLAVLYLREKKPEESRSLLAELNEEYPQNPLFRKELAKLSARPGGRSR